MASQGQDARLLWMVKPSQRALDGRWVLGHIATSPHRQGPSHRLTSWQGPVGACPRSPGLAIPLPIDIVTIGKPVVTRWDTGAQRLRSVSLGSSLARMPRRCWIQRAIDMPPHISLWSPAPIHVGRPLANPTFERLWTHRRGDGLASYAQ